MNILSIRHSKGNYQGSDYDNIVFQLFSDEAPKGLLAGQPVEDMKVKTDVVIDCFGKSLKSIDWDSLIGSEVMPTYGKYGQVISLAVGGHVMAAEKVPAAGDEAPKKSK